MADWELSTDTADWVSSSQDRIPAQPPSLTGQFSCSNLGISLLQTPPWGMGWRMPLLSDISSRSRDVRSFQRGTPTKLHHYGLPWEWMQAFLLATAASLQGPGSLPSKSLRHCPTSQHQAPNPSLASPCEHWRDFTPASDTGPCWAYLRHQNKHLLCRVLSKPGLGGATSELKGEPSCLTAQCKGCSAHKLILYKSPSPVLTFASLLMISSPLTDCPTKNTTRMIHFKRLMPNCP